MNRDARMQAHNVIKLLKIIPVSLNNLAFS